jgi:hypothetical protein
MYNLKLIIGIKLVTATLNHDKDTLSTMEKTSEAQIERHSLPIGLLSIYRSFPLYAPRPSITRDLGRRDGTRERTGHKRQPFLHGLYFGTLKKKIFQKVGFTHTDISEFKL